jgi:hypothetical protein
MEAAMMSGLPEFIADVGTNHFDTLAEMAQDFVDINQKLVNLKPDDVLRGLEAGSAALKKIRDGAPFVGYDQIRRGPNNPLLSMSAVIRCWIGSAGETPSGGGTFSAVVAANMLTVEEAEQMVEFLKVAFQAWRHDPETYRLWGNLNISLCMWLWRQLVKAPAQHGNKRSVKLSVEQFKRCLMTVAATRDYLDWLVGRNMSDRDRSPAYGRLKSAFTLRLRNDGIENVKLPSPAWVSNSGSRR